MNVLRSFLAVLVVIAVGIVLTLPVVAQSPASSPDVPIATSQAPCPTDAVEAPTQLPGSSPAESSSPSPAGAAPTADLGSPGPSTPPSSMPCPTSSPAASDLTGADPTLPPGSAALSIQACPKGTPGDRGCIDSVTTRRTGSVHVDGSTAVHLTVSNDGSTGSLPVTLLFFVYEPPYLPTFMKPVDCGGCTISLGTGGVAYGLEWPPLSPGNHELTVTLQATGRPATYKWFFAAYAEPFATVDAYGAIYTSAAFATGAASTLILPK